MDQFADAQTAGVGDLEQQAVAAGSGGVDQAHDFLGSQHGGESARPFAVGDEGQLFGSSQGDAVEETQGADGLVELAPGGVATQQFELEGADVVGPELVGGASEVASEAGDAGDVGLDGSRRVVAQAEVVEVALTQRGHGNLHGGKENAEGEPSAYVENQRPTVKKTGRRDLAYRRRLKSAVKKETNER